MGNPPNVKSVFLDVGQGFLEDFGGSPLNLILETLLLLDKLLIWFVVASGSL